MAKRLVWIGLGLLLLVVVFSVDALWRAGEFKTLTPRPLECRQVSGVIGPEDITVDPVRQVAYISATDARSLLHERPAAGGLYRYVPGAAGPTLLYSSAQNDFHPHGISYWSDGQGPDLLYVVNHASNTAHSIELFEVNNDGLRHVSTLRDPLLVSPNDVVAVGRDEFYVTNDHAQTRGPGQLIDDVLRRERAQILHVRAQKFRVVASDLAYANGINVARDGATLYVAEPTRMRMRVYGRALDTGSLTLQQTLLLGTGPDNIEIAADGGLYIGAHPRLFTFLRHAANAQIDSPSEVIRVVQGKIEHVYLNLGDELDASTVAAPIAEHVLIGSVFADHFLDCKLPRS
jgi:arylesterase/paraoxonase